MDDTLATLLSDLEGLATKPHANVHPSDLTVRAEGRGYRIDYSPREWSGHAEKEAFRDVKRHLETRQWQLTNLGGYLFAR